MFSAIGVTNTDYGQLDIDSLLSSNLLDWFCKTHEATFTGTLKISLSLHAKK